MADVASIPPTLSIAEAARKMGLDRFRIGRLIRNGSLGIVRYPGLRTRVVAADVEALIAASVLPATAARPGCGRRWPAGFPAGEQSAYD